MQIQNNYSLQQLNTFGINVNATYFLAVKNNNEIEAFLQTELAKQEKILMLGGGSNILFTADFDGVVVKNEIEFIEIVSETEKDITVKVGAGNNWHQFVLYCIKQGWAGVENLSLIPGCVGAAPIQNIGAYGVEVKQLIEEVEYFDLEKKEFVILKNADCQFGYRESIFKHTLKGTFFITAVTFTLQKQATINKSYGAIATVLQEKNITNPTIKDISDAVIEIRSSKLPNPADLGNAGSFFKNPSITNEQFQELKNQYPTIVGYANADGTTTKVAAGWLIEQEGWKGKRVGNTGCHALQALVIVNYGTATGTEIWKHSEQVIDSIKKIFNVTLEREVNIVPNLY